jgi:hypothetical protein
MEDNVQTLIQLFVGLVLYIFDVGSDIYVAVQYYKTGQWWWFGMTTASIVLPVILINIAASIQTKICSPEENGLPQTGLRCRLLCVFSFGSCSSIIFRYGEEFMQWKTTYRDNKPCECESASCGDPNPICRNCTNNLEQKRKLFKSVYELAWLCYIDTVTECAPQWCLQVYIMLRQWNFPAYTIVSTVFSLLSLAWNFTALEIARRKSDGNPTLKMFPTTVAFFLWQLFAMVSRLSAIVFCAYVLRSYLFIFIVAHWVLATLYHELWFGSGFGCIDLFWFLLLNYPLFFNVSESLLRKFQNQQSTDRSDHDVTLRLRSLILKINLSLAFRSLLMLSISAMVSEPDAPHLDVITYMATSCVLGGLVASATCAFVYFKTLHFSRIDPAIINQ